MTLTTLPRQAPAVSHDGTALDRGACTTIPRPTPRRTSPHRHRGHRGQAPSLRRGVRRALPPSHRARRPGTGAPRAWPLRAPRTRSPARPAYARAGHHTYPRNNYGKSNIKLKYPTVTDRRYHALPDSRRHRCSNHQRNAHRLGQVHDLVDFLGMRLSERASEYPEVVRVDHHVAPENTPRARHDAVGARAAALQPETGRPVPAERLDLGEGTSVKKGRRGAPEP